MDWRLFFFGLILKRKKRKQLLTTVDVIGEGREARVKEGWFFTFYGDIFSSHFFCVLPELII